MDNKRLLLFIVFGFSLFMLWEGWQQQYGPKPAPVAQHTAVPAPTQNVPMPSGEPGAPALPSTAAAPPVEPVWFRTDVFEGAISPTGGTLVELRLVQHRADQGSGHKEGEPFTLFGPEHRYSAQTGLTGQGLPNHLSPYRVVSTAHALAEGQDQLQIRLETEGPNNLRAAKIYTFKRGSYLIDVRHELVNGGTAPVQTHAYFQLQRDGRSPGNGSSFFTSTYTGAAVYTEQDKYVKVPFADIDKGKNAYTRQADNGWVAMAQHYFFSAWLPPAERPREYLTRKVNDLYNAGFILMLPEIAPGQTLTYDVPLYAGPQEQDKLKTMAPGLDQVVDYGWLTILAEPLFAFLKWLHELLGNWGFAIIVLTIMIKAVFYPLSAASYRSMARMRVVAPKLQKLKETYGDDRMKMNQAMMELYKTEKINPLGGCLPIAVQIPVFIALYWVLLGSVELRNASWFWVPDLAVPDAMFTIPWINMPVGILPIVMMLSMIIQIKLNPTPPDPVQAKVMMIMPFAFGFMFFFFPAGLVLYWVVNNILSIAQQWQITRVIERGEGKAGAKH